MLMLIKCNANASLTPGVLQERCLHGGGAGVEERRLLRMRMQSCGVADSSGCSGHAHAVCVHDRFKLWQCSVVARRSNQAVARPIQAAAWLTEHGRTHGDKQGRPHGDEERSIQGRRVKRLTCGTYTSEI
jgi:hypothetical protein